MTTRAEKAAARAAADDAMRKRVARKGKCGAKGNRAWCGMMNEMLDRTATSGVGLTFAFSLSGAPTRIAYSPKRSDHLFVLSFCPWCGADISRSTKRKGAAADG